MVKKQKQRFAIVFKKLDEILSADGGAARQRFDVSKKEADEIDELRRLALEISRRSRFPSRDVHVRTRTRRAHSEARMRLALAAAGRLLLMAKLRIEIDVPPEVLPDELT